MPSSHPILCQPLLFLPSIFPSIRVFSNESALHIRWPKYWSFSFSIIPSKEIPGLISFRMDWLDILAVQGTLKSLLQHHSSKASILQRSAFFMVQLPHPYVATGEFGSSQNALYSVLPDIMVKYSLKSCLFIVFSVVVEDAQAGMFKGNSRQTVWRGYLVCYFKLAVFLLSIRIKV